MKNVSSEKAISALLYLLGKCACCPGVRYLLERIVIRTCKKVVDGMLPTSHAGEGTYGILSSL